MKISSVLLINNIHNSYNINDNNGFAYFKAQPLKSDVVSFSGKSKTNVANTALHVLGEHIKNGTDLSSKDEEWLSPLRNLLGADFMEVKNPENPQETIKIDSRLSLEKVNNNKQELYNALKVMLEAGRYKPVIKKLGGVSYNVHNSEIAGLLREKYTRKDFDELMKYLNSNSMFKISKNNQKGLKKKKKTGFVKICGASENWEMSNRVWITDAMRIGDVQRIKAPYTWTVMLDTVADFYETQDDNFQKLIKDEQLYKNGGVMAGIPHIFLPETLEPDKDWFNNKRLESHALALKEFCRAIIDGMVKGKPYGYGIADEVSENMLNCIDNLSKFFKAIDYPTAPSAGNWEEIPLEGGLTSDTEAIRSALCAYKDLLYNPKYNKNQEIGDIRTRLQLLKPLSESELDDLITRGEARVRKTYLREAAMRPHDASLVFVTTSDVKLDDDMYKDILKHVQILKSLEKHLVRKNGMLRYSPFKFKLSDGSYAFSPDSYLNLNYFVAIDKNGKLNLDWKRVLNMFASKDCSEPDMFNARASLSTPNREAQWFMVSEMSAGYGMQILKLINNAQKEGRGLSDFEKDFIKNNKLIEKQTEYLNRALARISSENPDKVGQIKANGLGMPSCTVSEAFQYVTDVNGRHKMVQGTNAPLAWAIASLFKALQVYKEVQDKLN